MNKYEIIMALVNAGTDLTKLDPKVLDILEKVGNNVAEVEKPVGQKVDNTDWTTVALNGLMEMKKACENDKSFTSSANRLNINDAIGYFRTATAKPTIADTYYEKALRSLKDSLMQYDGYADAFRGISNLLKEACN